MDFHDPVPECQDYIKFPQGLLGEIRDRMLEDLSREQFALLLGKTERIGTREIVAIKEYRFFEREELLEQSQAFLQIRKDRIGKVIEQICQREDLDTLIDVHTHPFSQRKAIFSGIDIKDEEDFTRYLAKEFPQICYGSVVLSRERYAAHLWSIGPKGIPLRNGAKLMTSNPLESVLNDKDSKAQEDFWLQQGNTAFQDTEAQFNRSVLALGLNAMRRIAYGQTITLAGVGGLGSIIAENLVHSGFRKLHLIDHDILSLSNLNRIVGAFWEDAQAERLKVECLKEHLLRINPKAEIITHPIKVTDPSLEEVYALSNWVLLSTDNHASRFHVQNRCLRYATPFIAAGVNISVEEGSITDISGEVVTVRPGDNLCLSCLGRLDPMQIAQGSHFDPYVQEQLVSRGYVTGTQVKEPAVKTLNAILAALAVDVLLNQYTGYQKHEPLWIYENNKGKSIYPDNESIETRPNSCICHI
nr:ThiF family adenylyltransferase [uncultured Dethiosulfovibrio sp.]